MIINHERVALLEGGLKALKQARLPKWRGSFQWQIEATIDALQIEFAKLRAEATKQRVAPASEEGIAPLSAVMTFAAVISFSF